MAVAPISMTAKIRGVCVDTGLITRAAVSLAGDSDIEIFVILFVIYYVVAVRMHRIVGIKKEIGKS